MTFSSSPVQYPASSSPAPTPVRKQKRRLFQTLEAQQPLLKKLKLAEFESEPNVTYESGFLSINVEEDQRPSTVVRASNALPSTQEDVPLPEESEQAVSSQPLPSGLGFPDSVGKGLTRRTTELQTCSGMTMRLTSRKKQSLQTYEQIIADRSATATGRAKRAYYGIEIHKLIDDAKIQKELDEAAKEAQAQNKPHLSIERPQSSHSNSAKRKEKYQMWTEKYRAKRFTELVGDERTHRSVRDG